MHSAKASRTQFLDSLEILWTHLTAFHFLKNTSFVITNTTGITNISKTAFSITESQIQQFYTSLTDKLISDYNPYHFPSSLLFHPCPSSCSSKPPSPPPKTLPSAPTESKHYIQGTYSQAPPPLLFSQSPWSRVPPWRPNSCPGTPASGRSCSPKRFWSPWEHTTATRGTTSSWRSKRKQGLSQKTQSELYHYLDRQVASTYCTPPGQQCP